MATNTLRPSDTPRRANVPREVAAPAPAPEPVAEVPTPVEAPVEVEAPREKPRKAPRAAKERAPRSSWSIFSLLDRVTSVDGLFREGLPVRFLPHLLFVMALTLLYIGNTHYGNRMNRSIQRLKQETEDLRADYTTLKSDYMEASKQSEVARKVAAFGLVESSSPPFRINVPAGQLDAAELELMPVLTADTLAARADRDSLAAHLADSLAGRRRSGAAEDAGPEIIAPPQPLEATDEAAAVPAAPAVVNRAAVRKDDPVKRATPPKAVGKSKPNNKNTVQKGTSQPKAKTSVSQPTKRKREQK